MTIAIYAGSFDPITLGHLDILKKGAEIFDKVIIAVAFNSGKKGFLPVEKRVVLIKECVKDIPNIEVSSYNGLTVNYAKTRNATVLLRGLRNSADFEYENQLAQINSKLDESIKTVFLTSEAKYNYISSSSVREMISYNCDISDFVPQNVNEYLKTIK